MGDSTGKNDRPDMSLTISGYVPKEMESTLVLSITARLLKSKGVSEHKINNIIEKCVMPVKSMQTKREGTIRIGYLDQPYVQCEFPEGSKVDENKTRHNGEDQASEGTTSVKEQGPEHLA